MDDFNVNTVDVFTTSLGGLLGLMLLPEEPSLWLEKVVVAGCVFAFISVKRVFFPTPPARPDTTMGTRMVFLFLSIIGTGCTFGGIALGIYEVPELEGTALGASDDSLQLALLCTGFGLLTVSMFIDRWRLKTARPPPRRRK